MYILFERKYVNRIVNKYILESLRMYMYANNL